MMVLPAKRIFNDGGLPYPLLANVAVMTSVMAGQHDTRPETCPDDVWENVMLKCWAYEPKSRPSFDALAEELDSCASAGGTTTLHGGTAPAAEPCVVQTPASGTGAYLAYSTAPQSTSAAASRMHTNENVYGAGNGADNNGSEQNGQFMYSSVAHTSSASSATTAAGAASGYIALGSAAVVEAARTSQSFYAANGEVANNGSAQNGQFMYSSVAHTSSVSSAMTGAGAASGYVALGSTAVVEAARASQSFYAANGEVAVPSTSDTYIELKEDEEEVFGFGE